MQDRTVAFSRRSLLRSLVTLAALLPIGVQAAPRESRERGVRAKGTLPDDLWIGHC